MENVPIEFQKEFKFTKVFFDQLVILIKSYLEIKFHNKNYFAFIYGSFAYGVETSNSDLDLMIAIDKITRIEKRDFIKYILDIHNRFYLKIDEEVPHDKKLLVNFKLFEKGLSGGGFKLSGEKIIIPEIRKEKVFLESDEVIMRLALNSISGNNIFICGNKNLYELYKKKSIENILKLIISINYLDKFTIEDLIENMISNGSYEGELYLGYKRKLPVINYFKSIFSKFLQELVAKKILGHLDCQTYIILDKCWLNSIKGEIEDAKK